MTSRELDAECRAVYLGEEHLDPNWVLWLPHNENVNEPDYYDQWSTAR
jgi:hypothetical protein